MVRSATKVADSIESLAAKVVDEFAEALDRGERPSVEAFAAQYPELADRLRRILPAIEAMQGLSADGDAADALVAAPGGPRELGDFRILEEIGRGGMGVVYRAEQVSLGRTVALKVLPFAAMLDPRQLNRFRTEARAAASLHHPNIVPVFSVGCERSIHFYAMQFIEGESLARIIAQLRPQEKQSHDPNKSKTDNQDPDGNDKAEGRNEGASDLLDSLSRSLISRQFVGGAQLAAESPTTDWAADVEPNGQPQLPENGKTNRAGVALPVAGSPVGGQRSTETVRDAQALLSTARSKSDRTYFRNVAELGTQAAEALDYAHEQGVIHRDIKPANLLLDEIGRLWVTDFGLARLATDAGMTMTGDLIGTLRYMSPEQALAKRVVVDHRTDIYSLGATLYELLALRPVFDGEDREHLLRQIAFEEPVAPRKVNRQIPVELETILLKALRKNPAERYSTAKDLAADLRNYLQHKPIVAKPPTRRERIVKWSQRHPTVVVASILVMLVTTVAALLSSFLISKAYRRELVERVTAEESSNFLTGVLESNDPYHGGNRTTTIADVLDRAAHELDHKFDNDPRTKAQLLQIIANSYIALGSFDKGIPLYERARDLRAEAYGPEGNRTLLIANNLGLAYCLAGRFGDALAIQEKTLAVAKANCDDPWIVLNAMNNLATTYRAVGRNEDALRLDEDTLARSRLVLGLYDPTTLDSMSNLARDYELLGRNDEALKMDKETLRCRQDHLGAEDPSTVLSMICLAGDYEKAGRIDDAIQLLDDSLRFRKRVLGENNSLTLSTMYDLGRCYAESGRSDEAIALLEQAFNSCKAKTEADALRPDMLALGGDLAAALALAGRFNESIRLGEEILKFSKDKHGPDHSVTLNTMGNLVEVYRLAGRFGDAIRLGEESLKLRKAKLGPEHHDTLGSMDTLGKVYRDSGRLNKALPLLEQALKLQKAKLGLENPDTLDTMDDLAEAYLSANRPTEANPLARDCLAILEKKLPDDWHTFNARSLLGRVLLGQKKYAEAEPLLVSGYKGMRDRQARIPADDKRRLKDAIQSLVQLYEATNRPERVAEGKAKLAEFDNEAAKENPAESKAEMPAAKAKETEPVKEPKSFSATTDRR